MKKIEDLTYMQMHANFNFVDFKSGKPLADLRYNLVENCEVNFEAILWDNYSDNLYCYKAVK